jgi:hypothetical protein
MKFTSPCAATLDLHGFVSNPELIPIVEAIACYVDKSRARYKSAEQPIQMGLLTDKIYWSDTVPWYDWLTDLNALQACADECKLPSHGLANFIAYQLKPINWQVFAWMDIALREVEGNSVLASALVKYSSELAEMRDAQRVNASKAGIASGKARSETARCTPNQVASEYVTLMARGIDERNIASILANRFKLTPDHIRKLRKQAKVKPF